MEYNPFSLSGKKILVTGASSGIGLAIARECAKMGASLIICGRNEKRTFAALDELDGYGHEAVLGDLTDDRVLKDLLSKLPKLDGIVLSAGIVEMWPTLFATREKFDKIFNTNFFAPIELIRMIVKKKLYNTNMSIVAIDSVAGNSDFCPANSIYGSGKAALRSFLKFFALENANKGIRVNSVSPGMILTPLHTDGTVEAEKLQETIEKVPLRRWGTPQEVAHSCVFLLSDASSYITGTNIVIDGGYTI